MSSKSSDASIFVLALSPSSGPGWPCSANSTPAGGSNPRAVRRLTAVAAMLCGAVIGAALVIHQGFTTTLWVTAGVQAAITLGFASLTDVDVHHHHHRRA